jgi:hypothetical protein
MGQPQDLRGGIGLGGTILRGATCAHLPRREINDPGFVSEVGKFDQEAAAGDFDIVAVGGQGESVNNGCSGGHPSNLDG